jgi:hypothetical protein
VIRECGCLYARRGTRSRAAPEVVGRRGLFQSLALGALENEADGRPVWQSRVRQGQYRALVERRLNPAREDVLAPLTGGMR